MEPESFVFALSNGVRAMDPAGTGPKAVEARAGLTSVNFILDRYAGPAGRSREAAGDAE